MWPFKRKEDPVFEWKYLKVEISVNGSDPDEYFVRRGYIDGSDPMAAWRAGHSDDLRWVAVYSVELGTDGSCIHARSFPKNTPYTIDTSVSTEKEYENARKANEA